MLPTLRAANSDDLPRVHALLTANKLPLDGVDPALATYIVAGQGADIVGVAGTEPCGDGADALLRSVAVHDAWKGKGLGRALVERAIADAEARGTSALYLLTTTAERYFPSFGFREVERAAVPPAVQGTAEFSSACPASAVVMVRDHSLTGH